MVFVRPLLKTTAPLFSLIIPFRWSSYGGLVGDDTPKSALIHSTTLLKMSSSFRSLRPILSLQNQRAFYRGRRRPILNTCRCCLQPWRSQRHLVTQQVGVNLPSPPNEADGPESKEAPKEEPSKYDWGQTVFKMAEAALTTFASVAILG